MEICQSQKRSIYKICQKRKTKNNERMGYIRDFGHFAKINVKCQKKRKQKIKTNKTERERFFFTLYPFQFP